MFTIDPSSRRAFGALLLAACALPAPVLAAGDDVAALQSSLATATSPERRVDLAWALTDRLSSLGRYPQALEQLQSVDGLGDARMQAETLRRIGATHLAMGSYEAAEAAFQSLHRPVSYTGPLEVCALDDADGSAAPSGTDPLSPEARLALRNDEGRLLLAQGDEDEASQAFCVVMVEASNRNLPQLEARARLNRVRLQIQRSRFEDLARDMERASAAVAKVTNRGEQAALQIALGDLYRRGAQFDYEDLGSTFPGLANRALLRAAELDDGAANQSWSLGLRGSVYQAQGRNEEALELSRQALFHAQSIDAPEQVYRWEWQIAQLHLAMDDVSAAEEAIGRSADALDQVRRQLAIRGGDTFREQIEPVYKLYADIRLRQAASTRGGAVRQALLSEVRDRLEALKQAEIEDYFADACAAQPIESQELEAGVAVVYPILLPDRVEVLVETVDGLDRFATQTPSAAAEVDRNARDMRRYLDIQPQQMHTQGARHRESAGRLYELIVDPIEGFLETNNVETLVFVPEGSLRAVPLAALYDEERSRYLIEDYAVVTTPAIRLTQRALAASEDRILLGGLTTEFPGFPLLENVGAEIERIEDRYPGGRSEVYTGRRFTLDNTTLELGNDYSVVHLATHGEIEANYRDSFLATADSKLTLDRLQSTLRARSEDSPINLLVMSACKTASGDDAGRAALGLAGVAVQSGVRSAVASLWTIADAATAELMDSFYGALAEGDMSTAESLRRGQLQLLASDNYQHPRYWAPYILIGNWQ